LSTHLRLGFPSCLFPSGSLTNILFSPIRATCPAYQPPWLDHSNYIWQRVQVQLNSVPMLHWYLHFK
jgi:hypothetical protein